MGCFDETGFKLPPQILRALTQQINTSGLQTYSGAPIPKLMARLKIHYRLLIIYSIEQYLFQLINLGLEFSNTFSVPAPHTTD
jgi:hypothetical protein